jgi:hypothetical protein
MSESLSLVRILKEGNATATIFSANGVFSELLYINVTAM